jgi:drug/metabolite transporter (DMT)-like permease
MDDTTKGILFSINTALFWGVLAIFLKIALKEVDSITIVWVRFAIAFTCLTVWHLFKRPTAFQIYRRPPISLLVAALALGLNFIGYMRGVEYAGPATAQILIQSAQVMLVVVGVFLFKEKLSRKQTLGLVIAGVGFVLFYNESIANISVAKDTYNLGVVYTLFGAVLWVLYAALQKKLVTSYSPQQLNMIIYLVPMLMYLGLADFETLSHLSFGMWLLLIFLGLNTLIAYGSLSEAFKYLEATKVSVIITLNPIITISTLTLMAYMEVTIIHTSIISVLGFVGAVLVVLGAILTVTRLRRA